MGIDVQLMKIELELEVGGLCEVHGTGHMWTEPTSGEYQDGTELWRELNKYN